MKKKIASLILFALALPSVAQTYERMWKQVAAHQAADLPKSALEVVERVREKSIAEHDDAQLLRASLMVCVLNAELAPDSAQTSVRRMESALRRETRPVVQALWHSALAQTYVGMARYAFRLAADGFTADEWRKQAATHFAASLASPDSLADARVADYLPLFVSGPKSRPYADDLLHMLFAAYRRSDLLAPEAEKAYLDRFITLYEAKGRPAAALLLSLERALTAYEYGAEASWGGHFDQRIDTLVYCRELRALAEKYRALPENVCTYAALIALHSAYSEESPAAACNDSLLVAWAREGLKLYGREERAGELRAFLQDMENPAATLDGLAECYYPADSLRLTLRARHLKKVRLRITPIYDSEAAFGGTDDDDWEEVAAARRRKRTKQTFRVPSAPPYAWTSQTVSWVAPTQPGIYYAELLAGGQVLDSETFRVTALSALTFNVSGDSTRVVVADARSGHPVPGATVTAYYRDRQDCYHQQKVYVANAEGTVHVTKSTGPQTIYYVPATETDRAAEPFTLWFSRFSGGSAEPRVRTEIDLFTDRAIYRPGQEVCFSGVVYTVSGDDFRTVENYEAKVVLRNANRKDLDSLLVRTDAFGSFCGTFRLPAVTLPGDFSIVAKSQSQVGWHDFRVEEYKRPTFTAETSPVTAAYTLGDTVRVSGVAQSYSGVPVAGARVAYYVERYAWSRSSRRAVPPQSGETVTGADGSFVLPVSLTCHPAEKRPGSYNRFTYAVSYTVTADNGETAQGSIDLRVATHALRLQTDAPRVVYRRDGWQQPAFTVKQLNAADENLAASGTYRLVRGTEETARGTFRTGEPFRIASLATLPAASYALILTTTAEVAPDTVKLTLLDVTDTRPVDRDTPLFTHAETCVSGDTACIVVGTPLKDAIVYYDLLSADSLLESRQLTLTDSLLRLQLTYRPDYGDGATAYFALLRDGKLHTFEASVCRPEPDKRLMLSWATFRSRLTPGQTEEWALRITRPDGSPARAQLMAGMWDASLDAFARNVWSFSRVEFDRRLADSEWDMEDSNFARSLEGSFDYEPYRWRTPMSTRWRSDLFDYSAGLCFMRIEKAPLYAKNGLRVAARSLSSSAAPMAMADASASKVGGTSGGEAVTPRTNFAETAFFQPALRTDDKGDVRIAFTLPESTTRWNFSALAHDGAMNYGRLDTTVVARKEFMAEMALPRFLRAGDRGTLPVKLTNLTGRTLAPTLRLVLTDAQTGREVYAASRRVELAPGAVEVCAFDYETPDSAAVYVARATAEASGFSDGEERYLPVLSSDVEVTRTLPFSVTEKGAHTFAIDTLFDASSAKGRSLTVELSSNPTWYAVNALPVLSGTTGSVSAPEWATRLYALTLGQFVAKAQPAIRTWAEQQPGEAETLAALQSDGLTDATPWLREAETEAARAAALRSLFDENIAAAHLHTALDRLAALQRPDGGWAWCPGMQSSAFITVDVAVLLARAERLTGDRSAHGMIERAQEYLQRLVAKDVAAMKQAEKLENRYQRPTETQLRYLYLRALRGEEPDANANYLLNCAERYSNELTMYGKAVIAFVMAKAGRLYEADLAVQSLLEHTVTKPGYGRWFDTPRAEWSWSSYRIPTQCAAIEALRNAGLTAEADEMRLWLLQAKRTQMWETSRATADAVYTLLAPPTKKGDGDRVMQLTDQESMVYTLRNGKRIVGFNAPQETTAPQTLGYVKQTYTDKDAVSAKELVVRKRVDGLSWGAAYATYTVAADQVRTAGKGLTLARRFEVQRGTAWEQIDAQTLLKQGERVRQVVTLTADRDYDFVTLSAARPACLEPARPLSGYDASGGLPAYRAVHDDRTDFFVEQVRKGTHHIVEEFFTDRAGRFASGISRVECTYAPEFCGTLAEENLTVE